MNEKKAKEALEAARVFISGLSQYDNLIMPRAAFQEAKGVLYTIGVAQGVYEASKVAAMPDVTIRMPAKPATGAARDLPAPAPGPVKQATGPIDHGDCAKHNCICPKVMIPGGPHCLADTDLWQRVKTHYVLSGSIVYQVGARVLDGKFATAPESDAVREMLQRLVLR